MSVRRASIAIGVALAALTVSLRADAALAESWPEPNLPADAQLSLVGASVQVNGMPVRIYEFATRAGIDAVIEQFRRSVEGTPRRVSVPGSNKLALGGRSGSYWLTVQLHSSGRMTRGTWSATPQFTPNARREVVRPPGFPATAQLLQQIDSYDDGTRSQLVVGMDRAGIDALAEQIEAQLQGAGYAKQPFIGRNWSGADQYTATYSRAGEEILVSLNVERTGTTIVLNRLTALGRVP